MLETIISSLIVALITGLMVFAIKYKLAFDKVIWKIYNIVLLVYSFITIWTLAVHLTFKSISKYIDSNNLDIAKKSIPYLPFDKDIVLISMSCFIGYLHLIKYVSDTIKNNP